MNVQRTASEIIIRIPSYVDIEGLQRVINFLTYKELTAKSNISQEQVDELASEVNKGWWGRNKDKFIQP